MYLTLERSQSSIRAAGKTSQARKFHRLVKEITLIRKTIQIPATWLCSRRKLWGKPRAKFVGLWAYTTSCVDGIRMYNTGNWFLILTLVCDFIGVNCL